jgi:hypothetical protein
MILRILASLIAIMLVWGAVLGVIYTVRQADKPEIPQPVLEILENAKEWRIHDTSGGCEGIPAIHGVSLPESFGESRHVRAVRGATKQGLQSGLVRAIQNWPAGEQVIIAALGWSYLVEARAPEGTVTLLFKSTGELITYESSLSAYPEGSLNLTESWRGQMERAYALGTPVEQE